MNGLKKLVEQQHEYEAYKIYKAKQLEDHVDHLKYLITTKLLEVCENFDHSISDQDTLVFAYKELTVSIKIINPITEKRNEKEYNLSQRVSERLIIILSVQKKKDAKEDTYTIKDKTQYKKNGPYVYEIQTQEGPTKYEDFLEILNLYFNHISELKVEFKNVSLY
jgi:hypothetical protein